MWGNLQCGHHTETLSVRMRTRSRSFASIDVVTLRPIFGHLYASMAVPPNNGGSLDGRSWKVWTLLADVPVIHRTGLGSGHFSG